jgi:hypothetical protein
MIGILLGGIAREKYFARLKLRECESSFLLI